MVEATVMVIDSNLMVINEEAGAAAGKRCERQNPVFTRGALFVTNFVTHNGSKISPQFAKVFNLMFLFSPEISSSNHPSALANQLPAKMLPNQSLSQFWRRAQ